MKFLARCCAGLTLVGFACVLVTTSLLAQAAAPVQGFGVCKPVSERTTELGCWVYADQPLGRIDDAQAFWHLDTYPTRADAEKAKGPRGTVIEALGKVWLMTIEKEAWRPTVKGERVSEIGPIPVIAGGEYSAVYMESVFTPGMSSEVHNHSGAEAFYTLSGEACLETPAGKSVGRAGGPAVIVPAGPPMFLMATGTTTRRGLTLILHDSSKPPTNMVHDWTPKGLCKVP